MDTDFSGVRAWFDDGGSAGDDEMDAGGGRAFRAATDGKDVVFSEATPDKTTVAHELIHVAQGGGVMGSSGVSRAGETHEREARSLAGFAAQGVPVEVQATPTGGLHLDSGNEGGTSTPNATHNPGTAPNKGSEATLTSSDAEVDGRTVSSVGKDLTDRATRYKESVSRFRRISESTRQQEIDWYNELGVIGGFIDLFNDYEKTNPNRWDLVMTLWQDAEGAFNQTLAIHVSESTIHRFGQSGEGSMRRFEDAYNLDQRARSEFLQYMEGFQGAAEGVLTATTLARDISFAAAVGVAVVVAAPVVFAGAGAAATGIGLTGTAATVATYGGTAVTLGLMGGAIEGGGQSVGALVVEGGELISGLMSENTTWEQAIDDFSWEAVADQGWEGFKRGFVDGILAYAGMGFEKVLHRGTRVAMGGVLGEAGGSMLAQILRRATERAIAGGVSGGVIGALDAGIKAAMAGGTIGDVMQAIQNGFVMGAAIGTAMGTAGGALEGRNAARITAQLDELQRLLREDPRAFTQRYNELVRSMTPEQRTAFQQEVQGRRFVDAEHYGPAREAYESGSSSTLPAHRYGEAVFDDWTEAASMMDGHAASAQSLARVDIESAHASAGRHITPSAGQTRDPGLDVLGAGGVGHRGMWTALSPEQIAVLESNPYIRLEWRGMFDSSMTPQQLAARFETAVIFYPPGQDVTSHLDDFIRWYGANRGIGDPIAFAAEAQQRLISIHPFADGNGRVSRLVMDHALQSRGLPPPLLSDPNIDYMVSQAAWADEVRAGVLETFHTAERHVVAFNEAANAADPVNMAKFWGLLVGLAGSDTEAVHRLYNRKGE